jgi:hypothetical protein
MKSTKQYYQKRKAEVREEAIEWQAASSKYDYSYWEVISTETYFRRLGKRYGLLKEFKENAIC